METWTPPTSTLVPLLTIPKNETLASSTPFPFLPPLFQAPTMADTRGPTQRQHPRHHSSPTAIGSSLIRRLQAHTPASTHLIGFLTLVVTTAVFLLLTGLTVTAGFLGIIFLTPLIVISSPVWFPVAAVLFVVAVGAVSVFGFGVAVLGGTSWGYRYFRGMHPVGADRVDYARNQIYDTASHVKDYAREYGGYLQSKVKDAAPGA